MSKSFIKVGLVTALAAAALGSALLSANAATISFSARVYSLEGRERGIGQYPGYATGLGFEHEALYVDYQLSGLPYYVSEVRYLANSKTKFRSVAGVPLSDPLPPGGEYAQPVTVPVPDISGSSVAPGPATFIGADNTYGNGIKQLFAEHQFYEGSYNAEMTYVRIDNTTKELKGTGSTYGSSPLYPFDGSTVTVVFTPVAGAPAIYHQIVLSAAFGISSSPAYGPGSYGTGNFGSTGGFINIQSVPEPGMVATFLAMGVALSVCTFRARRRA